MTISRRRMLGTMTGAIAGGVAGIPAASGEAPAGLSPDAVGRCEDFAGARFTPAEQRQMTGTLDEMLDRLRLLRAHQLDNHVAPAVTFDPRLPGWTPRPRRAARASTPPTTPALPPLPVAEADIAFAPAWQQAR